MFDETDRESPRRQDNPAHPGRRAVIGGLGAALLSLGLKRAFGTLPAVEAPARSQIEQMLKPLLIAENPAMFQFAVTVYERCILGRIQPAEPPFKHAWLIPGGGHYVGQWIWDITFVTDLVAILPGREGFIRGVYANYWDFQERWNAAKPEYAHGMVANYMAPYSGPVHAGEYAKAKNEKGMAANSIAPDIDPAGFTGKDWQTFPTFSQAPLLAWGVERVYARNRDLELVRQSLKGLEAFHDWYWRERDLDGVGLVTVGSYDGVLADARYETYDDEVDLDTLKLAPHPGHAAGTGNGPWYGDIYIPANTSYLLLAERSLIRLAEVAGDKALAARRRPILKKGVEAMRRHMWDEAQGCFLAVHRDGLRKVGTATVGGLVPLYAGIPTARQAARMAEALASPHWNTPVPIPSVDRLDGQYKSDLSWRGDVWPATVYQTLGGLAHYGHFSVMGEMAGRLLDNALKVGVSESYDSQTGAPLGVPDLNMSSILLTMALEGLSPRHRIHWFRTS